MVKTIRELKADGLTVILSEQNLHFPRPGQRPRLYHRKKVIRYSGTMAELAADTEVGNVYLTV